MSVWRSRAIGMSLNALSVRVPDPPPIFRPFAPRTRAARASLRAWSPRRKCGKITQGEHEPIEVTLTGVPDAVMREATQLPRQNRAAEAIKAYHRIVARWPGQADSWFNLAVLQRQGRRLDDAPGPYQRAL